MMSVFAMEFFNLDPSTQEDLEKDYSKIIWVQTADEVGSHPADKLALRFNDFGDFNIFKDSQSSFYMEFYFIEPATVPTQTIDEMITIMRRPDVSAKIGLKNVVLYKDATKFKAHNRIEQ